MLSEIKHLRKINTSITNPRARPVRHWKSPHKVSPWVFRRQANRSSLRVRLHTHCHLEAEHLLLFDLWHTLRKRGNSHTLRKTLKLSNVCMTLCTDRTALLGNSYLTFEANRVKPLTCRNQWQICNRSPDRHVFFFKSSSYLMNTNDQVSGVWPHFTCIKPWLEVKYKSYCPYG